MKYVYRKQLYTDLQHSLLLVAGLIVVGFAARKSTSICASSPKFFDDTNSRGVGGQQADVQMKVLEDCIIFLRPAISKLSSSSSVTTLDVVLTTAIVGVATSMILSVNCPGLLMPCVIAHLSQNIKR